ncbi:16S rRNA (guanine(527)-N(7))-methyltransferase RsmG [Celeribacter neptunius]|uniref:Ribosomal RNA small subunit methyltransferase G n=1 Tax=Celeribacter neptunius TaxID=588602 RepID=A0A1I3SIT5_9RHOB|nr:16S rRNA (guanine(527)-N(7))-methyltransferase RsmG [Celeribacter neptunius]SFJ58605.1 16S rRNA (guanine527-N7)-methyltransferase [Celeribacter neptunius]
MRSEEFGGLNVSRETLERLETYHELLKKWNPVINLVAKSTIDSAWERHFLDSAQVFSLAPQGVRKWCDLGSGGGFPGLVCATLAAEFSPETEFTLVESDQRKATFLRTVARELGLKVTVLSKRIEQVEPLGADLISARALAALPKLLEFTERHLEPGGYALFQKGESFRKELSESLESWRFSHEEYPSITDASSVILRLGDIERV